MDEIHLRLKEFIVRYGLKNKEISEKLGYSIQKVSDLRSNKQKITPEIALDFEKYYQLNPCWLIFGRGNMTIDIGFDLEGTEKETLTLEEVYKKVEKLTSIVSDIQESYGKK
jgi:plasmid maintenance system antidote protein VapI